VFELVGERRVWSCADTARVAEYAFAMGDPEEPSLYSLLAEEPRENEPGETMQTKAKETLDNDAEAQFTFEVGSG
jgi:hypothetical protein